MLLVTVIDCTSKVKTAHFVGLVPLMEKLRYLDQLEEKEKSAFFALLDSLIAKKKLKDNLSNLVAG